MGIYRSVTVTCRYNAPSPSQKINATFLYPALGRVVSAQPMLRVGILKEETNEATFCHIKTVDLSNHVSFKTVDPVDTLEQYNEQIASQQGWHHDQLWHNTAEIPPWRIAIVEPSAAVVEKFPLVQDIIFSYHHALLDGTSGKLFHQNLLKEINYQLHKEVRANGTTSPTSIMQFPDAPRLPEAQDQIIQFTNSATYLIKTLWNELGPTKLRAKKIIPWHGKSIDFAIPYVTRTKPVDFQPDVVAKLLKSCREHNTTITGLFHALTVASFASRLPASEASSFSAATPISLRPFLGPNADPELKDALRVLVTSYQHAFPADLVTSLRGSSTAASLDSNIWKIAQRVKTELIKRVDTMPKDDINGLMKYNSDWFGFFQKMDGKPRKDSWEISNIGVFKDTSATPGFTVSRVYFTNGAMVTGAPVALGVGSVPGGMLTIAFSWQEGVVSEEFVNNLAADITSFVTRFDEKGVFGV